MCSPSTSRILCSKLFSIELQRLRPPVFNLSFLSSQQRFLSNKPLHFNLKPLEVKVFQQQMQTAVSCLHLIEYSNTTHEDNLEMSFSLTLTKKRLLMLNMVFAVSLELTHSKKGCCFKMTGFHLFAVSAALFCQCFNWQHYQDS